MAKPYKLNLKRIIDRVPEIQWPNEVCIHQIDHETFFALCKCDGVDYDEHVASVDGKFPYQILRVQPPVERKVEIDWEAVNRDRDEFIARGDFAGGLPVWLKESIEAHARVVEEPK